MKFASLSRAVALSLAGATAANAATTLGRAASASPNQATAPSAACPTGPGALSYNTDCAPVAGTIACGADGLVTTAENSYYRRYVFPAGTPANATVNSVRYAIETATGTIAGAQVRLYTIPTGTALTTGALTQIGSAALTVAAGTTLAEQTVAISPAAVVDTPATKDIVVELFQPDLEPASAALAFGSNGTGTGVTYIRAPDCGITQPTDMASIGFPTVKIIASLTGTGLPVELQDYSVD